MSFLPVSKRKRADGERSRLNLLARQTATPVFPKSSLTEWSRDEVVEAVSNRKRNESKGKRKTAVEAMLMHLKFSVQVFFT